MRGLVAGQIGERMHVWSANANEFMPGDLPSVQGRALSKPAGFIKGPLPLSWIQCAAQMPGKTMQVGLALWYLSGLKKSRTVRLASKDLKGMGVSRDAKYEALARLVAAGLVAVEQKAGQAPLVTLRECEP